MFLFFVVFFLIVGFAIIFMYGVIADLTQEKYADVVDAIYSSLSEADKKVFTVSNTGTVRRKAINILDEKVKDYV